MITRAKITSQGKISKGRRYSQNTIARYVRFLNSTAVYRDEYKSVKFGLYNVKIMVHSPKFDNWLMYRELVSK